MELHDYAAEERAALIHDDPEAESAAMRQDAIEILGLLFRSLRLVVYICAAILASGVICCLITRLWHCGYWWATQLLSI